MDTEQPQHRPLVVVGIDGSPASRQALRFAADEARQRGADLEVVTSFDVPDILWPGYGPPLSPVDARLEMAKHAARKVVDSELPDQEGMQIEVVATTAPPTVALVERSTGADLLVVGSRGHGGFRGLIVGSVSLQCVLHARCPVAVVHATYPAEPEHNHDSHAARPPHSLDDARLQAGATFL